jgi:hypothetical protein
VTLRAARPGAPGVRGRANLLNWSISELNQKLKRVAIYVIGGPIHHKILILGTSNQ